MTAPTGGPGGPGGPATTFAERFVARASGLLAGRTSRRSFLAKTAVVGSALAVNPWGYILRPGTAYGALCGTCTDGWTAFCCTINQGSNSCPDGSFVAGWWKADNAAFCCGSARYIIDCNATCPTSCSCRCSGASCDGRRTCCNQFRYGQCHQEIACYGPVVCRVATCTPPWQYDASCTSTSATDNNTVTHGAPCLADECTPIAEKYRALGGPRGILGAVSQNEQVTADRTGRYALYAKGAIFARTNTKPYEVHGPIAARFAKLQYHRGALRYPVSDQLPVGDAAKGVFNRFEGGVVYAAHATGTHEVLGATRTLHSKLGGVKGTLGYPTGGPVAEALGPHSVARYQDFQKGSIWEGPTTGAQWLAGAIRTRYRALGGARSVLGLPTVSTKAVARGTSATFQHGAIYALGSHGGVELVGPIHDRFVELQETAGPLGFPTSSALGPGSASIDRAGTTTTTTTPATPTMGAVTTSATFEHGTLTYDPTTGIVTQS